MFQSPSVPSVKPAVPTNAKFFIPAPTPAPAPSSNERTMEAITENTPEDGAAANEDPSTSTRNDPIQSPASSLPTAMQRFSSMGSITNQEAMADGSGPFSSQARRTVSWSGSFNDVLSPPRKMGETKPLGEVLGVLPLLPHESSMVRSPMNSGNFGEDLQEVEL